MSSDGASTRPKATDASLHAFFNDSGRILHMPNIAMVLKEEIARLARKELRANTEGLKKAVASYRSEIAALKRRIENLERQAKRTQKVVSKAVASEPQQALPNLRFRSEGLKAHRERLGLSASEVAKILGCSQLSVYKWESGKTRPRAKQLESIALLRKMGKREAAKRLEELGSE
jgi:Predicted transcriptional regulator